MGGISAMHSIQRFIDKHGEDVRAATLAELPSSIDAHKPRITLANEVHRIDIFASWTDPVHGEQLLQLPGIDIETAIGIDEDQYASDCEMGY